MNKIRFSCFALGCLLAPLLLHISILEIEEWRNNSVCFRDYSGDGANYAVLKGVSIKARSVDFDHFENLKILGTTLKASVFKVRSPIEAQFFPIVEQQRGNREVLLGNFTITVAPDPVDVVRKGFLRRIAAFWASKDKDEYEYGLGSYSGDFLWSRSGQYVLYSDPINGSLTDAKNYVLYAHGNVFKISFQGFSGKEEAAGGISNFLEENLRFDFSNAQIRCELYPESNPERFLKQFQAGNFSKRPE